MARRLWTVFKGPPNGARSSDGLRVTISKHRVIYLNQPAFNALGRPDAVELMFDDLRNIIGMRRTDPARYNAFPVKLHTTKKLMRVNAAAFCSQWRIEPHAQMLFRNATIDDHGVLELPLDHTVRVQRGAK